MTQQSDWLVVGSQYGYDYAFSFFLEEMAASDSDGNVGIDQNDTNLKKIYKVFLDEHAPDGHPYKKFI